MSCFTNNCATIVSSNCISYQGDTITSLDICKGDDLTSILEILTTQVISNTDGSGILLSEIDTNCSFIANQMAGKTKTLFNLIQTLVDSSCTLSTNYTALDTEVNAPVSYNLQSIITSTDSTTPEVLQGTINKLAEVNTTVDEITSGLGTTSILTSVNTAVGNALSNNITAPYGLSKTGSGENVQLAFSAFVPPFCPIFCVAPLSNFNADGSGKTGTGFQGYYICNGLNGTPDMRGYVGAGATSLPGITSPSLQSVVDSTVSGDPSYATTVGQRVGEVKHGLTVSEMPSHSVSGTTDPHNHTVYGTTDIAGGEAFQSYNVMTNTGNSTTSSESVAFTSNPVGSNVKHENRQPSYCGYFIMRIS